MTLDLDMKNLLDKVIGAFFLYLTTLCVYAICQLTLVIDKLLKYGFYQSIVGITLSLLMIGVLTIGLVISLGIGLMLLAE